MLPKDSTLAAVLGGWLGLQLAAVGIASARISLSAHYPRAGEELALAVMLVSQTGAASLFFPILCSSIRSTFIAIAVAWPMAAIASFLADAPTQQWIASEAYISIWIIALYFFQRAIVNPAARLHAAAIAGLLCWGGLILWYLRADFSRQSSNFDWQQAQMFGPTAGALAQLHAGHGLIAWMMLMGILAVALTTSVLKLRFVKTDKL
jgi:hypothetical protein